MTGGTDMTRLIDADALRDKLQAEIDKGIPPFDDVMGSIRCGIRLARNIVEDEPTIDAEPVRHGKWMPISSNKKWIDVSKCSVCGKQYSLYPLDYNYCPNCGADMRGESE
jgi:hypothetical protein